MELCGAARGDPDGAGRARRSAGWGVSASGMVVSS